MSVSGIPGWPETCDFSRFGPQTGRVVNIPRQIWAVRGVPRVIQGPQGGSRRVPGSSGWVQEGPPGFPGWVQEGLQEGLQDGPGGSRRAARGSRRAAREGQEVPGRVKGPEWSVPKILRVPEPARQLNRNPVLEQNIVKKAARSLTRSGSGAG